VQSRYCRGRGGGEKGNQLPVQSNSIVRNPGQERACLVQFRKSPTLVEKPTRDRQRFGKKPNTNLQTTEQEINKIGEARDRNTEEEKKAPAFVKPLCDRGERSHILRGKAAIMRETKRGGERPTSSARGAQCYGGYWKKKG